MRRSIQVLAYSALAMMVVAADAGSQDAGPTGASIVAKAQAAHVETRRAARTIVSNRMATFTPVAEADLPSTTKGLESGAVVGVLAIAGPGGTLTAGQYDVYVTRTSSGWETLLERDGVIGSTSRSVTVMSSPAGRGIPTPVITATGFEVGGRAWRISTRIVW